MSPAVTNHFRSQCVPNKATQDYLTDITAQQATIDEVFWGNKFIPANKAKPAKVTK